MALALTRLLQRNAPGAAPGAAPPPLGLSAYGPLAEQLLNATDPANAPAPALAPASAVPAPEPDAQAKASLAVLTQAS